MGPPTTIYSALVSTVRGDAATSPRPRNRLVPTAWVNDCVQTGREDDDRAIAAMDRIGGVPLKSGCLRD
jgi:hypothetical protein